jgi:hypothetical protein
MSTLLTPAKISSLKTDNSTTTPEQVYILANEPCWKLNKS